MLRIISVLLLAVMLPGCGNKGPLYLPSEQDKAAGDQAQQAPRR